MLLVCHQCRQEFDADSPKRRFCSGDCYHAYQRAESPLKRRIARTCVSCGASFEARPSDRHTQYCTHECYVAHKARQAQARVEAEHGMPIGELLHKLYWVDMMTSKQICPLLKIQPRQFIGWCESFEIPRRDRSTAVAKQWTDRPERRQEQAEVMRKMQADGTINNFGDNNPSRNPDVIRRLSEMRKGAGNPMYNKLGPESAHWKGGKITYRGAGWRSTRTYIVRRDGNKCRRCGATDLLQVHHIIPYRETQDNSPKNLVTLCARCHAAVEHCGADLVAEGVIRPGIDTYKLDRPVQLTLLMAPLHTAE